MNIVILNWRDLANPMAGGAEVVVDKLLVGLSERGHTVTLICGGPVGKRPYRVIRAGKTYSQYLLVPFFAMFKCADADLIIDADCGIPFFSPIWSRAPKVCLVHHLHTDQWADLLPIPLAKIAAYLEKLIIRKVYRRTTFVAVSHSTKDALEALGVVGDRINVIESGVEVAVRGEWSNLSKSETPIFVCLGRQVPHKRTLLVLEAWSSIVSETDGELVILGDGPDHLAILRMARNIPRVKVLGRVSDKERDAFLESAWLQINASHHEGWGITVLEAAVLGTPTLAFDVPGIRDAIIDNNTGVLIPNPKDSEISSFAMAWKELAMSPTKIERLSRAAHARALSQSWERSIDKWEELLLWVESGP